ncbi:MAG: hypothetical protein WAO09_01220 [Candidatus Dormiibacterota bacterium]|jgi:hypothetical protein
MSDSAPPEERQPAPPTPVMRPTPRRNQRQWTLFLVALVALLILIRVIGSHPFPTPSHLNPAATVAGYITGIQHEDLSQVSGYLAPKQRPHAEALLKALAQHHASITAPSLGTVLGDKGSATVTISAQVCYQPGGGKQYSCYPISQGPLGLTNVISCVELRGKWYATTLLKPS